jgi:MurNAc alpha-1-phosphate uridylyltransferase
MPQLPCQGEEKRLALQTFENITNAGLSMRAIILAAGLGTRLKPLTDHTPKALVHFKGMPMVERVVRKLAGAGIWQIMVNVHHYAGAVAAFLERLEVEGVELHISDESSLLMDTGGALLKARQFLKEGDCFIVHNVDVFTNLNIPALIRRHREGGALATLAVKKRPTSRSLLFDGAGCLCGWVHNETGEKRMVRTPAGSVEDFGNTCVQVIDAGFLDFFPETRPRSLTDMYLELAGQHRIGPFIHNGDYWYDLGRYENFIKADKMVIS